MLEWFSLQILYVEETAKSDAVKFFRTQSPRHFEGGDWDQGGSCERHQPLSTEQVILLFLVISLRFTSDSSEWNWNPVHKEHDLS